MASRRKRGGDDHGGGGGHGGASGRWLVSYADFITLMFVVFLVLFSMARLDSAKYGTLSRSLRQAMGPAGPDIPPLPTRGQSGQASPVVQPERPGNLPDLREWPAALVIPHPPEVRANIPPTDVPLPETRPSSNQADPVTSPPPAPVSAPPPDPLKGAANSFQGLKSAVNGALMVALEEQGIVLGIAGKVLFEPGKTALRPEAQATLNELAAQLKGLELPIRVEGTTDEKPDTSPGALSSWDLTGLRAGAVVQYLVEKQGLPASQFITVGYGASSSASQNEHRILIVVMRKKYKE